MGWAMQPHRSKFGAKRTQVDGQSFDSKREARRYGELLILQYAGEIKDLKRQVKFPLQGRDGPILTPTGRQMTYVADFTYSEGGVEVIEDLKGHVTDVFKVKEAILRAMGITIKVTK
jgi:hypothetical protein